MNIHIQFGFIHILSFRVKLLINFPLRYNAKILSCSAIHLGFLIHIKITTFVRDHPIIVHTICVINLVVSDKNYSFSNRALHECLNFDT